MEGKRLHTVITTRADFVREILPCTENERSQRDGMLMCHEN